MNCPSFVANSAQVTSTVGVFTPVTVFYCDSSRDNGKRSQVGEVFSVN